MTREELKFKLDKFDKLDELKRIKEFLKCEADYEISIKKTKKYLCGYDFKIANININKDILQKIIEKLTIAYEKEVNDILWKN